MSQTSEVDVIDTLVKVPIIISSKRFLAIKQLTVILALCHLHRLFNFVFCLESVVLKWFYWRCLQWCIFIEIYFPNAFAILRGLNSTLSPRRINKVLLLGLFFFIICFQRLPCRYFSGLLNSCLLYSIAKGNSNRKLIIL